MLTLNRKLGELIHINDSTSIEVSRISANSVRLTIYAPDSVSIVRQELLERIQKGDKAPESGRIISISHSSDI
ncbi:carbon storage regulator [Reinekea marinisedimentorum]|uniref:Carbon storage regulator n=1 Tax=Reinekea marinisedimentorum TaxID=230495 RepID=A0A4R3HYZ2_9GAMM|nr:carbon storage regulator [Reinekea marinisedimentorum]